MIRRWWRNQLPVDRLGYKLCAVVAVLAAIALIVGIFWHPEWDVIGGR